MTDVRCEAVVIGASAGALEALNVILPALPPDFPVPVMVVVHVPAGKRSLMAELFQAKCRVRVREAEDKEPLAKGTIYFAPPDYHLLVEDDKGLALSSDEAVLFSRPSIDVLFESAADTFGPALVAIVLTGANHDGAKGANQVLQAGGKVIIQDPIGAFSPTMPEAAVHACQGATVSSLEKIAMYLSDLR